MEIVVTPGVGGACLLHGCQGRRAHQRAGTASGRRAGAGAVHLLRGAESGGQPAFFCRQDDPRACAASRQAQRSTQKHLHEYWR